jgi:hypothetical protein
MAISVARRSVPLWVIRFTLALPFGDQDLKNVG